MRKIQIQNTGRVGAGCSVGPDPAASAGPPFSLRSLAVGLVAVLLFAAADWPAFRGGEKFGDSTDKNVPVKLDAPEALAWKADLPGKGHSSPIVVGGRAIVTCSSGPKEQRLRVICFDA